MRGSWLQWNGALTPNDSRKSWRGTQIDWMNALDSIEKAWRLETTEGFACEEAGKGRQVIKASKVSWP